MYAGHLYEPSVHDGGGYDDDSTYVAAWEGMRVPEAATMNAALRFGEWGGSPDQPGIDRYVDDVLTMADRTMSGWAWWSWDPGGWSPVTDDGTTPSANGKRLMRVQPRSVAGTPNAFSWDRDTRVFELTWADRPGVQGDTEVAVPEGAYPDGFGVFLDDRKIDEPDWDPTTGVLAVPAGGDSGTHHLCVGPKDACA